MIFYKLKALTHGVVPAVDSKQAAAGHRDYGRHCQVWQCVGSHMGDRRVGGKLQYHYDVLLHLLLKHERTLWKETLMKRQSVKERGKRIIGEEEGRVKGTEEWREEISMRVVAKKKREGRMEKGKKKLYREGQSAKLSVPKTLLIVNKPITMNKQFHTQC